MPSVSLNQYIELIDSFVRGKIQSQTFEKEYLEHFNNDLGTRSKQEFILLNDIFSDVDAFCSEPELCDEYDIDESELKKRCVKALKKLKKLNSFTGLCT